ncbi:MAG: APC family permease [Proteobacteria bacterium]|nr:APC family permease [Pseudomonadota bacterium]
MQTGEKGASGHLVRDIGLTGAMFLILNGMIGAGIFALPATIAASAGMLSPWLFLGVGLLFITIVLCFAELASYFRSSGGPVLYATSAFGPLVGFNTGWLLFLSRMTAFAANTTVMVLYIGALWPWAGAGIGRALLITLIIGGLTLANVRGVKDGMRTVGIFTVLKLVPLLLLVILGLGHVGAEAFLFPDLLANLPTIDDFGGTILLLVYAFVGFEQVANTAGETRNPRRDIPRALVLTVLAIGLLYFLITLVYVSVLPGGGGTGQTLVDVGRALAGPVGALAITLAAIFSIGGNLASSTLAVPRLTFALAEERLLPRWFGHIHEKFSTPDNSILLLGGLALVFALTGSFVFLAVASTLARMLTYILCIAALPVIRRRVDRQAGAEGDEARARAYRLKGGYAIPLVALVLCIWIAAQSTGEAWMLIGGLLAVGLILFWLEQRRAGG